MFTYTASEKIISVKFTELIDSDVDDEVINGAFLCIATNH